MCSPSRFMTRALRLRQSNAVRDKEFPTNDVVEYIHSEILLLKTDDGMSSVHINVENLLFESYKIEYKVYHYLHDQQSPEEFIGDALSSFNIK